jgi:peptide deformylase
VAARAVIIYPDARLRRKSEPVAAWDENLAALAGDVVDTMAEVGAVGLTAAHVGAWRRLVVIRLDAATEPLIYVNPDIVWTSPETAEHSEGSVSMPGVTETLARPARIRLRFQDLAGQSREEEVDGFLSTCLQHEIDHLDGVFWIDRLSRLKRERVIKRYEKLRRNAAT